MTTESQFIALTDRVLRAIGTALDDAFDNANVELDWSENDGVLTIDCPDASKLIINRHVPNRELWVAAKSGAFHFRAEGGAWRDTRSGEELAVVLARLLRSHTGIAFDLPALPGPTD